MKVTTIKEYVKRKISDCLIVPFFEGAEAACSEKIDDHWKIPIETKDFTGKNGELSLVYQKNHEEKRTLLLGLGKKEKISQELIRNAFAEALKRCQKIQAFKISILFPSKCKLDHLFEVLMESLFLSNYLFHRLKKDSLKEENHLIESVQIIGLDKKDFSRIKKIITGVHFVRDLVNNNADDETPQRLAVTAKELEKVSKNIKVTVFDKDKIEKENMQLLLAVNRGSFRDPTFIRIDYTKNTSKDRTVLIGKGITYDTGGLSLKPSTSMHKMKSDMSGAAAVLGVMYVAAQIQLPCNITALIPATENAIGPKSYKPGDVYSSYSGKTVEVENTDAEGRLILADAISYAVKEIKPTRIIDIASLTGAIVIALGEEIAGVFSNSDSLYETLQKASKDTGELIWRLPLHDEYRKMLKSFIADIKNVGGRKAGSITAALFLEEFVQKIPWMHIDIGGTAYYSKPKGYYTTSATGFGVRLLISFLEKLSLHGKHS